MSACISCYEFAWSSLAHPNQTGFSSASETPAAKEYGNFPLRFSVLGLFSEVLKVILKRECLLEKD